MAVFAAVAAIALVGLTVWLTISLRRVQDGQRAVLGPYGRRDLVEHVTALEEQVRNLRDAVEMLTGSVEDYRRDLDGSLSHIGMVRYDAFMDPGGQQSASMALLDSYGSGIAISILASRDSARLYVKHLDHGRSDRELSPEEREAVRRAVPQPLPPGAISGPRVPTLPRFPTWTESDQEGSAEPNPLQGTLPLRAAGVVNGSPDSAESDHRDNGPAANGRPTVPPPVAAVTTDEMEALEADGSADEAHARECDSTDNESGAYGAESGKSATRQTARRANDDWLGGEELDF